MVDIYPFKFHIAGYDKETNTRTHHPEGQKERIAGAQTKSAFQTRGWGLEDGVGATCLGSGLSNSMNYDF